MMVNTLDTSVFEKMACRDVVWESQWVWKPITGLSAVLEYLKGKHDTLRDSRVHPLAQLGYWWEYVLNLSIARGGGPLAQPGHSWEFGTPDALVIEQFGAPFYTMIVQANSLGYIKRVDVCSAPSPAEIRQTGEFPGLTNEQVQAKRDMWLDDVAEQVKQEHGPVEIRGYYMSGSEWMRETLESLIRDLEPLLPGCVTELRERGHNEESLKAQGRDMVDGWPAIAIRRGEALVWPAFSGRNRDQIIERLIRVGLIRDG